jgi:hypothetical protein
MLFPARSRCDLATAAWVGIPVVAEPALDQVVLGKSTELTHPR